MATMRKDLFPKLVAAYEIWTVTGNSLALEQLTNEATAHWRTLAEKMLEIYREQGPACQPALITLIEANTL